MHAHLAHGETRLQFWLRVRQYAVPEPMIETSTARRLAGDWAAACAAAHVDVDLNLRQLARQRGPDIAAQVRADLRHLAPDLLRWHLPRISPDGLLRPGLTIALARYDADLQLVVRTPPAWASAGQRFSLALWSGETGGPHPHPRPDRYFRLDRHRHLWDARCSAELRNRARPDWVAEAAFLQASVVLVRAANRRLLLDVPSGEVRPARTRDARIPLLPYASTWPAPDLELLEAGLIDPVDLHPLVAAALIPHHATRTPQPATPNRSATPHESSAPHNSNAPHEPAALHGLSALHESFALHGATAAHESTAPHGPSALHQSSALHGATAAHESTAPHGPSALHESGALHELAGADRSGRPNGSSSANGSVALDTSAAAGWAARPGTSATRTVECRGAVHRIGLVGGVLTALDHDAGQLRREELLMALGGPPLPCLRAIDRVHRHPESLDDVQARLDHGDAAGALAAVEELLGPNVLLRAGALRDALKTELQRRIVHGLFRAGLIGRNVPARRAPRRQGTSPERRASRRRGTSR
ncbi:hypothetical protein [Dactylosporangium matsuzakiense]|uniref:Uncharacterized protein n=1 Tax=Dactylosporangium matsuzakiense TaxID=53360 RepID=A0A9W6KTC5_9ACTN|nr:hypothetical protein [Dactylosporangium matsuzakiense]GLL06873.1 hypothetical protein GCM10017581_086230 [Dactylosporangium matsuzakiense]